MRVRQGSENIAGQSQTLEPKKPHGVISWWNAVHAGGASLGTQSSHGVQTRSFSGRQETGNKSGEQKRTHRNDHRQGRERAPRPLGRGAFSQSSWVQLTG